MPIVLVMGELTSFINAVKMNGMHLGFFYPAEGPVVQLLGIREFQDQLSLKQLPACLILPG